MRAQASNAPTVLVVFGATGDLMERKIAPSLFNLHERGRLPERFRLVGFARRDLASVFRDMVGASVERHHGGAMDATRVASFLDHVEYARGQFDDPAAYDSLSSVLRRIDDEWGVCANKLFYLAVPPANYAAIIRGLTSSGLASGCPAAGDAPGWTRVIIEKPFGHDAASARELDALLAGAFEERQIYRIDHYLAKEMLQGVMSFRFSNNLLERAWNNRAIERIEIDLLETLGVEDRGDFYDSVGALRDVGQNHLLQMLGLLTMDRPAGLDAEGIRSERARAIESLRPFDAHEVAGHTYRAQYEGYRDVEGVAAGSSTETFFEIVTEIDSARWRGVPIVMRAGKRMPEACKRVSVVFKRPQPCFCAGVEYEANRVIFGIEPVDSITITFWTKRPGFEDELEERDFAFFLYEKEEKAQYVEEYARLLDDAIRGDQTLFVSDREVRAMWAFTDPIVCGWQGGAVPLATYEPGTDGALEEASALDLSGKARAAGREIGVVGLGRMGAGIALNLSEHGWRVVGFNRTTSVADALAAQGVHPAHTLHDLVAALRPPRTVWLMLPAGAAIDEILFGDEGLASLLSPGDVVIEGGNSRYTDDAARAEELAPRGIDFIDVGVSGGPAGARHGACLMVGGDRRHFDRLRPLWRDVSLPDGFRHFPGIGAGHFVKMVHNGIEYGMMQAIAEGFAILKKSPYEIDLAEAASIYDRGSVIESRLIAWLAEAFRLHGVALDGVSGSVGHTGEGQWTVEVADELGIDAPVISDAMAFRLASQENPSWTGQVLSGLREQFGQHAVSDDAERQDG